MTPKRPKRAPLRPGQTPWDTVNGFRVGAMTGGLVGGGIALLTSFINVWPVIIGAAVGGAVGYWSEKRKQDPRPPGR